MEYLKKNKGLLILIVAFLALIMYNWNTIADFTYTQADDYSERLLTSVDTEEETIETIMIDIKGEVNYPGLYEIESGSRIGDIIQAAGGITVNADLTDINLAQLLEDQMVITIPKSVGEVSTIDEIIMVVVEIKGEVSNPGIYTLNYNSRVNALIEEAGGFTKNADTSSIELARLLVDGETIIVASIETEEPSNTEETNEEDINEIYVQITGEVINPGTYLIPENYSLTDLIYLVGGVTVRCDISKINWNVTLCQGAVIYIPSFDDSEEIVASDDGLININTANLDELMTLPGIGQIIGQRIIDYRAEYGDFASIEDIMLVSGIKDSTYEDIKEFITV